MLSYKKERNNHYEKIFPLNLKISLIAGKNSAVCRENSHLFSKKITTANSIRKADNIVRISIFTKIK